MKICVYGLWHLGTVTAACLGSRKIRTIGLAETLAAAAELNAGRAPLYEPELDELIRTSIADEQLSFTADVRDAISSADVVWVTFDTPVDDDDVADVDYVLDRVRSIFPHVRDGAVILISSQVPVGSTARLEREFEVVANGRTVSFAYSPENLRLGDAIRVFTEPERIVIGVRDMRAHNVLQPLLEPFCDTLLWTGVESAEMVKHALNAFLATCVTFTNEVATVCERVGADMSEVEGALRLDPRIGKRAYVRAGAAFGGGTLARDVQFLQAAAAANSLRVPVLQAVLESNREHKNWVITHLQRELQGLSGKRIGVLGLAYKAGTDAIRRSLAVELLSQLIGAGATSVAFDPKVAHLPESLGSRVSVVSSAEKVFEGADAVVLVTAWPEFQRIDFARAFESMRRKLLIDQNAFVANSIARSPDLTYIVAGKVQ